MSVDNVTVKYRKMFDIGGGGGGAANFFRDILYMYT